MKVLVPRQTGRFEWVIFGGGGGRIYRGYAGFGIFALPSNKITILKRGANNKLNKNNIIFAKTFPH